MATSRLPIFQERFKALRGDMTQGQFAEKLGISRPTVGLYESGARIPDAEVLRDIATRCDVSADWLLGLSETASPDITVQLVCRETGLSDIALSALQTTIAASLGQKCIQLSDVINFLLTYDYTIFDEGGAFSYLEDAFQSMRPLKKSKECESAVKLAGEYGYTLLSPYDAKDYYLDQAVSLLRSSLDEMIRYYAKEAADDGQHTED